VRADAVATAASIESIHDDGDDLDDDIESDAAVSGEGKEADLA
jgi:hypothetical protein